MEAPAGIEPDNGLALQASSRTSDFPGADKGDGE